MSPDAVRQMREDWNQRAAEDAKFYIACERRHQTEEEFLRGGSEVAAFIRSTLHLLPPDVPLRSRRLLEIGCGVGRLMRQLSGDCGEIHGVDISDEMVRQASSRLADLPHAHAHVAADNDLRMFADDSFHTVYSYAVFQHIPEESLVLAYLAEALRVLRPGGILIGHFNGAAPARAVRNTWVGAWFHADELAAAASRQGWQVLAQMGAETNYLWLTLRKPTEPAPVAITAAARIHSVIQASDGRREIPAGGPYGFASLYVENLPWPLCDTAQLQVLAGERPLRVIYLGPAGAGNVRQINVQIPADLTPGELAVTLRWRGAAVSDTASAHIVARPLLQPQVTSVCDGTDILSEKRILSGWLKVHLIEYPQAASVQATLGGLPLGPPEVFCPDPILPRHELNWPVPEALASGTHHLQLQLGGTALPPIPLEVVRG